MKTKHKITINGTAYDAITGLPVNSTKKPSVKTKNTASTKTTIDIKRAPVSSAKSIHRPAKKSTTLKRTYLTAPKSQVPVVAEKRTPVKVTRSAKIYHFAPHPEPLLKSKPGETKIVGDVLFPATKTKTTGRSPLPSSVVKEKLIENASKKVSTQKKTVKSKKKSLFSKPLKRRHIFAISVALLFIGGYLMFQNMPGLSMRMAASEAGMAAKYPTYNPDGYRFVGPISYQPGEVELNFKSNSDNSKGYTVRQKVSGWNSTAVLDNLVARESKGDYVANSQGGVIVYTYGSNAAWSNGGILYTIDSNTNLSNEQLLHIASSL